MTDDHLPQSNPNSKPPAGRSLLVTVVLLVALIVLWHFILPLLGLSIVLTAAAGSLLIWFVPVLVVAAMLFFILPFIGALLIGILMSVMVVVVIVLFPILLPIIFPVWLLCALVVFLFKR